PNGKVLVAGGDGNGPSQESAELYDPASGTWTATGSLSPGTSEHTATLLPNGKVLVAGGVNGDIFEFSTILTNAELDDPTSEIWTTAQISRTRNHTLRRSGPGRPPAASAPPAPSRRPPGCPTARCSSQEVSMTAPVSRARNCTIRRAGPGRPPAASAPHAMVT